MSIFKLAFEKDDGSVVELPSSVNKHTPTKDLKAFARKCGYDVTGWTDHKDTLTKCFSHVALLPANVPKEDVDLDPFKIALKREPGLFALPWTVFQDRFANGVLNVVLDGNGTLVSTMNVIPKLNDGIKGRLEITEHPENPQVFETGAGWTAESHRGIGLYTAFRRQVLQEQNASNRLLLSQARGKGASFVNIRDGWTLVNWREFPFASALLGWPKGDGVIGQKFQLSSGLVLDLPRNGLYVGETVKFDGNKAAVTFQKTHIWEYNHHFWANDYDKLNRFEQNLRFGLGLGEVDEQTTVETFYRSWLETIQRHSFVVNRESAVGGGPLPGWNGFVPGIAG